MCMCVHASVKGVLDAMDHGLQVVLSHVDMNSRNQMLLLFNSTIVEPSLQSIDNGLLVNNVKYLKVDYNITCKSSFQTGYTSPRRPAALGTVCLVLGHWRYIDPYSGPFWHVNQVTHCCGSCHVHHSLCSGIPGSDLHSPRRSWPNLSPGMAKCPLLRMAVLRLAAVWSQWSAALFPLGNLFSKEKKIGTSLISQNGFHK